MKKALTLNALFSGLSGIILIIFSSTFAKWFELPSPTPFWITGLALLFFSLTILYEIKRQNDLAILWIIIQDILWVIGSILLLIFRPFGISTSGHYTIAAVALVVLYMAIKQAKALAQFDNLGQENKKQLLFSRKMAATKSACWELISDVGNYHKMAPNIDRVKIISGKGEGQIRSCSHGKDSWSETCTLWEEEKQYSFEIDTTAPDYPYPFKFLKGSWEVKEVDPNSTSIQLTFEFTYKHKIYNILIHPMLKARFKKVVHELMDNYQQALAQNKVPEKEHVPFPGRFTS